MLALGFVYAACGAVGQAEHAPLFAPAYLRDVINPRQELSHVGINPRVVGLSTALAPAHDAYQAPREFVLANQGAAAVTLQGRAGTNEAALPPRQLGCRSGWLLVPSAIQGAETRLQVVYTSLRGFRVPSIKISTSQPRANAACPTLQCKMYNPSQTVYCKLLPQTPALPRV